MASVNWHDVIHRAREKAAEIRGMIKPLCLDVAVISLEVSRSPGGIIVPKGIDRNGGTEGIVVEVSQEVYVAMNRDRVGAGMEPFADNDQVIKHGDHVLFHKTGKLVIDEIEGMEVFLIGYGVIKAVLDTRFVDARVAADEARALALQAEKEEEERAKAERDADRAAANFSQRHRFARVEPEEADEGDGEAKSPIILED